MRDDCEGAVVEAHRDGRVVAVQTSLYQGAAHPGHLQYSTVQYSTVQYSTVQYSMCCFTCSARLCPYLVPYQGTPSSGLGPCIE